ncbi:transmembrane protein, putative [Medicago truncatula]|uniref:Transmembrane protein, putative n=1 Tax=Medicago truncatula TaxID=3880 RepID=A0A072UX61_MEDTR|nr:transmembrane protein, putative [Medicago truncatula]
MFSISNSDSNQILLRGRFIVGFFGVALAQGCSKMKAITRLTAIASTAAVPVKIVTVSFWGCGGSDGGCDSGSDISASIGCSKFSSVLRTEA